MLDTVPNLWPQDFKIDVQTPYTILRVQANLLSQVTRGILVGEGETETSKDRVQHRLVIIAPAYNGYRHTLVVALHNPDLPYPAEVRAQALAEKVARPNLSSGMSGPTEEVVYPLAKSDEQMQGLVRQALQAEDTRAMILSLIARSNEAGFSPELTPQAGTPDLQGKGP